MNKIERTVLIVDDSPTDRMVYRRYLQRDRHYTYAIVETERGDAVLALCQAHQPDCILLDYNLPDQDGLAVLSTVVQTTGRHHYPVVMITGHNDVNLAVQAMQVGAHDYLLKNQITPETIQRAINNAIEKAQLERKLEQQRDWFQLTLASIGDAVIATDTHGHITFMNPLAERLTGWHSHEAQEQPLAKLFAIVQEATQQPVENPVAQVLQTGVAVELADHTLLLANDGHRLPIDGRAAPIQDSAGNWLGVALVFRDISERKEAEKAAHAGEARFRRLADTMPQIVWTCEADGTMTYINAQWLLYSGMTFAQSLAMGMWPALHSDDQSVNRTQWRQALERSKPYEAEVRLRRHDGVYRWFLERALPMRDDKDVVQQWFGVSVDIDDRKRIEDNQSFLLTLDLRIRQRSDRETMLTTLVSALGERMGVLRCFFIEVDGAKDRLLIHPEWGQSAATIAGTYAISLSLAPSVQAALAAGQSYAITDVTTDPAIPTYQALYARLEIRAAIIVPYILEGRWLACLAVTSNEPRVWRADEIALLETVIARYWPMSEHARVEAALVAIDKRLRLALEGGGMGIWEAPFPMGEPIWSEREYSIFGLAPGTLITRELFQTLIHPKDWEKLRYTLDDAMLQGSDYTLEYRIIRPDGAVRWLAERATAIRDEDNHVRLVGINFDITERKIQEEALRQLNAQLEARVEERTATLAQLNQELQRSNHELEQFNYAAAHDLKSPLRGIQHLVQWLSEDAAPVLSAKSQKHLSLLDGRVHRLDQLLDGMLDYSRIGRVQHAAEVIYLNLLVENIVELLAPPDGFVIETAPYLPTLVAQRVPLETVLRNLISNAIKHHHQPQNGHVQIAARAMGGWIEFRVSDNGPGIAPDFHERIFGMFQTLLPRDRVEGSGIGLALVQKTVESFGGKIWVDSDDGQGATFTFTWPNA